MQIDFFFSVLKNVWCMGQLPDFPSRTKIWPSPLASPLSVDFDREVLSVFQGNHREDS